MFLFFLIISLQSFSQTALPPGPAHFIEIMKSEKISAPERPELFNHYYQSQEVHDTAIVVLPGMGEYALKYFELPRDLKNIKATWYLWDNLGHGDSAHLLPGELLKVHIDSFDTYILTLENFLKTLHKNHKTIYVIAHSMGAHVALRTAFKNPELIQKLVLSSPMVDVNRDKVPIHRLAWLFDLLPNTYYPSLFTIFKKSQNPNTFLTHDEKRIALRAETLKARPQYLRGGPTMGWLSASIKSINQLAHDDYSKLHSPVLILQAEKDILVSDEAQDDFCKRLPHCRVQKMLGSFHEVLYEQDSIRGPALESLTAFFAE